MAFADCALKRLPDDSQANLGWRDDIVAMVGRQRPDGLSAGLRIPDMTLLVFDGGGAIAEGVALEGRTMDEAVSSLDSIASELTGKQPDTPTKIRDYEMPDHPLAEGAPFVMDGPQAFAEVARWFANGNLALTRAAASDNGWSDYGAVLAPPFRSGNAGWPRVILEVRWRRALTRRQLVPRAVLLRESVRTDGRAREQPATLESGGHWHTEWLVRSGALRDAAFSRSPRMIRSRRCCRFFEEPLTPHENCSPRPIQPAYLTS